MPLGSTRHAFSRRDERAGALCLPFSAMFDVPCAECDLCCTSQDWGTVAFSNKPPGGSRPASARGPGPSSARGPGSAVTTSGKTAAELDADTENLKRTSPSFLANHAHGHGHEHIHVMCTCARASMPDQACCGRVKHPATRRMRTRTAHWAKNILATAYMKGQPSWHAHIWRSPCMSMAW